LRLQINSMKRHIHFIIQLFLLFILSSNFYGQNYISYSKKINAAESFVLQAKYNEAIEIYDSVFNTYGFCFAEDYFVALQVACFTNDTSKAIDYIKRCFRAGIDKEYLLNDLITKKICTNGFMDEHLDTYDSLSFQYNNSIDKKYRGKMIELTSIDQFHRDKQQIAHRKHPLRRLIWKLRWKKVIQEIVDIELIPHILENGYPGEKVIGLRKLWMLNKYRSNAITEGTALLIFKHYYAFCKNDYSDILLKEISKGNLRPSQYAVILDFQSKFTKQKESYYNEYHLDPDTSEKKIAEINLRRQEIGLESIEQHTVKYKRAISVNIYNRAISQNQDPKDLPIEHFFKLMHF
jgi:hypothetical protein